MKIEHESVDAKLKRLNDENDAKSIMFDWIHELAVKGSMPSAPRAIVSQELKKKLDIFKAENLAKPHADILKEANMFDKLCGELQMSKIFSIIIYNVFQIFNEVGLFQSSEKFVRKNPRKFPVTGDQLFEIWSMFKNEQVSELIAKLNKNRVEMQKFRMKMGQDTQSQQEAPEVGVEGVKKEDESDKRRELYIKRINAEFNSLKSNDF